MNVSLRSAVPGDIDFAKNLYYQTMREIIERLFGWNEAAEDAKFVRQFVVSDVHIIMVDGEDIGWLQTVEEQDAVFLQQIYITPPFQRRGIGTRVIVRLFEEADRRSRSVTLAVVKANPAIGLYRRLGFRTTHEDQYKFYMRRDRSSSASA